MIEDGGGIIRIVFGYTARAPRNQTAGLLMVPEPRAYSVSNPASPALKLASVLVVPEPLPGPQAPPAAAPVASPLMAATESRQQQPQTQITVVPPTQPQVPTTPTPIPQYQGELISIDIKDYDIKDFFRLISEISGLNVVIISAPGAKAAYFARVGDELYDAVVKNIKLDTVTFALTASGADPKAPREIVRRVRPNPGENK